MLVALAQRLGWQAPATIDEEFTPPTSTLSGAGGSPAAGGTPLVKITIDLRYDLQLTPEFAEIIAGYQRVCFVDAHTGNIPDEINVVEVKGEFQRSPFTHHMTPATCLAMAQSLYGGSPEAILVSVRGYEFGFVQSLSARTQELADQAARRIYDWLAA